jgi:hypothetical protein
VLLTYEALQRSLFFTNHLFLNGTYKARLVAKNGHQKTKSGLCAENILSIIGSIVNTTEMEYSIIAREQESSVWTRIAFASRLRF